MSWKSWLSTLRPTDWAVSRISLMVPENTLAIKDWCHICQAMLTSSSKVLFPLRSKFFCFCLCTWGLWWSGQKQKAPPQSGPICSERPVSLSSSGPSYHQLPWWCHHQSFLETRARGLILGARAYVAPTSPLVHLRYTTLISLGSKLGGMVRSAGVRWTCIWDNWKKVHLCFLQAESSTMFWW